jgi:hypothetical protein
VVDLIHGHYSPLLQAFFAQWVGCNISIADAFPCAVVALGRFAVALVAVVVVVDDPGVLLAVSVVGEAWTSGIGTRSLRFPWHRDLPWTKEKRQGYCPDAWFYFDILIVTLGKGGRKMN